MSSFYIWYTFISYKPQRWGITTYVMCTLCSKDLRTAAHILEVCKVSLRQRGYTFRHYTVLPKVIEALKNFILNMKKALTLCTKLSIKFPKKGPNVPRKRILPLDISYHASNRILLRELNSNYCFPVCDCTLHSIKTWQYNLLHQLKTGHSLWNNISLWRNMESWYGTNFNKYLTLKAIIKSIGWCVKLFAVVVVARWYCSKSVLCCIRKVGFSNTLIRNTIKKLTKSSMEYTFCIWLARNDKDWTPSIANCKLDDSSKETCNSSSSVSSLKQTTKPV